MKILTDHLNKFKIIKQKFLDNTTVPKKDNWRENTNNDIWLKLICQVIVVQGSMPAEKFNRNEELKKIVSYERLSNINDKEKLEKDIHYVLKACGTRINNRKTKALVYNFGIISNWNNGPKGFLETISGVGGTKNKLSLLMSTLKFIKSKGARDFLMELGIINNAIALDIRIQNILKKKIGMEFPSGVETSKKLYNELENILLEKICKPLDLSGVQFDRMLYQNYDAIMEDKLK